MVALADQLSLSLTESAAISAGNQASDPAICGGEGACAAIPLVKLTSVTDAARVAKIDLARSVRRQVWKRYGGMPTDRQISIIFD
jgi:hypothetical protein